MFQIEEDHSTVTTIEDLQPDLLIHVLHHLDGSTLVAASRATSRLRSLSTQLLRRLCLINFPSLSLLPSLPISHSSFFSQAHPFPSPDRIAAIFDDCELPANFISAIDINHRGLPVLSRIVNTDASSSWFRASPFRVDALDRKDLVEPPPLASPISPEELTLNWVIINPATQLATNVSSRRLLAVDRHWYTGETLQWWAAAQIRSVQWWQ